ncbi:MAG: fused MFS/spermidine synthase [Gammaproteobacteria bacterium]
MESVQHQSKLFLPYLLFTAVLCGALIMVIEVMGSRVIGPFFGVGLFVWTSLIAVTLLALAGGYALGGVVSDRFQQPAYLFGIILAAGVLTLLVPVIKGPVLKACMSLGLRGGAFVSTAVLFGPALLLLGCVAPYLVKLAARELHNIGRVVGGLYALSTVGSTVGTVFTGFYLIAYLGVDQIFAVTGGLLLLLAVGYFLLFQQRWWAIIFLILPVLLYQPSQAVSRTMSDGTKVNLIHNEESYYGNLKVVDYSFDRVRYREMIIDGMVQGGIDLSSYQSTYEYNYFMQFISYALVPEGKSCLVIGLGLGIIPNWYEQQGIQCDVVDINPAIVDVAEEYFGFKNSGDIFIEDARYFLNSTDRHYDYIVLDVFSGDITPAHLLSIEALGLMRDRLTEQGVLAVNLIGSVKHETYMTASVVKTLEAAFDQVGVFPVFDVVKSEDGIGNLAIMAYQGDARSLQINRNKLQAHPSVVNMVFKNIDRRFQFPSGTPAMVLTDDYNPIDFFDSWLREKVRKSILESTDWDILIS